MYFIISYQNFYIYDEFITLEQETELLIFSFIIDEQRSSIQLLLFKIILYSIKLVFKSI